MRALPRRASALLRIVAINDCYERAALPRLKTLLARRKAELPPSSSALISTLSGDFVSPSILSGMDAGRSQVAVLNACPITHCCFGNHEADLQLAELAQRCAQWGGTWLNSNLPGMAEQAAGLDEKLPPYDVIQIPTDGRRVVRVGLIGLLTSEPGVFRHDRFRGLRIEDSMEAAQRTVQSLRSQHNVDAVVALTHQSVAADKVLAASGLVDLVLGGHEHEVILLRNEGHAPIVKAGQDAEVAALVDMSFEVEDEEATGGDGSARAEVASVQISFEEVAQYPPEPELQAEVDSHHAVLTARSRFT
jgi:2',3'-cyclic-nucleotide 2'-phosphodiesterase (5'-nucleotidase family)